MEAVEFFGIRTRVPAMLELLERIRSAAPHDLPVLIEGETGTGKELVATALHGLSGRSRHPLVVAHCGAMPEALAESELFGHERGAFTGADHSYRGRIEAAAGGTLFLDEVNSLPLSLQVKLLRFLERGEVCRLGREHPTVVNARVISASNQALKSLVDAKHMRADFFYRLNVIRLHVPSLVDRIDDLPLLLEQFLADDLARRCGLRSIAHTVQARLAALPWPGNVRELFNVLRRSMLSRTRNGVLVGLDMDDEDATTESACPAPAAAGDVSPYRAWILARDEEYFFQLTAQFKTVSDQVHASGLPHRTLYRKLRNVRGARSSASFA